MRFVFAIALAFAPVFAYADDAASAPPVRLVQGTSEQLKKKPAKLFYNSDSAGNSYSINAALVSSGYALPSLSKPNLVTSEITLAAGVSKDTVAKNPSDTRTLQPALNSEWVLPRDAALQSALSLNFEDDHLKAARGHMERMDLEYVFPGKHEQRGKIEIGQSGYFIKPFPYAGVYERHITSTADVTKAPLGHYGGPYIGAHVTLSYGSVTKKATWFQRLGVDINALRIRDTSTSASYVKASYNFASATITYALYDSEESEWKPSLAFTRTDGTDRLSNQPYKLNNYFGLQLSYGL